MLTFLASPRVTSEVLQTRLTLESNLLEGRRQVVVQALRGSGFRAPEITPPRLGQPPTRAQADDAFNRAGKDPKRARELLLRRGFDVTAPMFEGQPGQP